MEAVKNSSALKCDADTTVVIYGKNPLREALMDLFAKENFFRHVMEFIPKDSVPTSAKGALHIVSLTEKISKITKTQIEFTSILLIYHTT